MIYFIQDEGTLNIKVGFTEGDAQARVKVLQTGCPGRLVLLGSCRGTQPDERHLHKRFKSDRVLGEWFRPVPALLLVMVDCFRRGWYLPTALPPHENGLFVSIIEILQEYGWQGISRRGPDGSDTIALDVAAHAREVGEKTGFKGLRRIFTAVEEWALDHLSEGEACAVLSVLDHRFDGIAGWYA